MNNKKFTKIFLLVTIFFVGVLPLINIVSIPTAVSKKALFTTDNVEGYANYVAYKFFDKSLLPKKVIAGKDGFLFLGNNYSKVLDKTKGTLRPPIQEIEKITNSIKNLQTNLKDIGVDFIFVIAPNKHSIYKEKLPDWMKYDGQTITDDVVSMAKQKQVKMLDLRPMLISKKSGETLLYKKTDTHWNNLGASYGFSEIISFMNSNYDTNIKMPDFDLGPIKTGAGDLASFLKIKFLLGKNHEQDYKYNFEKHDSICIGKIKNDGELNQCSYENNKTIDIHGSKREFKYIVNENAPNKLKILFLRDSFGTAPSQLYNATFNTVWKMHYLNLDGIALRDFINKNKPDMVIFQMVERHFGDTNFDIL